MNMLMKKKKYKEEWMIKNGNREIEAENKEELEEFQC